MSLDIGRALRDGFDRTTARNGLIILAAVTVFRLLNAVVGQSLQRVWIGNILDDLAANPPSFENSDLTQQEFQDLIAELRETVEASTQLAYLDSLSVGELVGIVLLLALVAEALHIVVVRTFVSDETESIPREFVTRNLPLAVLNGVVGGIVVGILVGIGLLLLIVPGIFLAVSFAFLRQEIAVEDKNFIDAMSGSWNLAAGNRIELFGLLAFLAILGVVVGLAIGALPPSAPVQVASVVVLAAISAYGIAVVSRAYDQLRVERAAVAGGADDAGSEDDEFADIDDELLP